jgi:parallel beta-helix repeat protein
LLVGTILPVTGNHIVNKQTASLINGNTLYVGGYGGGNYTSIQDAINDASDGYTVYVYDDSSPYIEKIVIDKSINLIGEDKNTTVIDGNLSKIVISINEKALGVCIQGFTIQNSKKNLSEWETYYCGLEILSNDNIIKNNIFRDNLNGIKIGRIEIDPEIESYNNVIEQNIFNNNKWGITILLGFNNIITNNFVTNNEEGIQFLYISENNLVTLNDISQNNYGIQLNGVDNITIIKNTIHNNKDVGVYIEYSSKIKVLENNIYNNIDNAFIVSDIIFFMKDWILNKFDGNYWGTENQKLVLINGGLVFPFLWLFINIFTYVDPISIPFYKFDRNPASEPYDIEV